MAIKRKSTYLDLRGQGVVCCVDRECGGVGRGEAVNFICDIGFADGSDDVGGGSYSNE